MPENIIITVSESFEIKIFDILLFYFSIESNVNLFLKYYTIVRNWIKQTKSESMTRLFVGGTKLRLDKVSWHSSLMTVIKRDIFEFIDALFKMSIR